MQGSPSERIAFIANLLPYTANALEKVIETTDDQELQQNQLDLLMVLFQYKTSDMSERAFIVDLLALLCAMCKIEPDALHAHIEALAAALLADVAVAGKTPESRQKAAEAMKHAIAFAQRRQ